SRRRHTRWPRDWSSDVCSSDLTAVDGTNAVVPTYIGTVHITTSDARAKLPGDATLARGVGSFTVTFNTTGSQTINASDTVGEARSEERRVGKEWRGRRAT